MSKPEKPTPDFPLYAHNTKRWAKKIAGKLHYFGTWDDPAGALAQYESQFGDQPARAKKPKPATKPNAKPKPEKPYPEFPLTAHNNGQWVKRIGGKLRYFGPWDDPDTALALYKQQVDDLRAGREPRPAEHGITIQELFNRFANRRRLDTETGELDLRTWNEYDQVCKRFIGVIDKTREVASLREEDFEAVRRVLAKSRTGKGTVSLVTFDNYLNRLRCVFSYAAGPAKWIPEEPNYGAAFKRPKKQALKIERGKKPKKMFEAEEIAALIDAAQTPFKAFILLGINCGFENKDCALLRFDHLDLDRAWIDFPRNKTGANRRCPLWPQTVGAIRDAINNRREKVKPGLEEYVFFTKYGNLWCNTNGVPGSAISQEMGKLLDKVGGRKKGVAFLALRHTFQTVGEGSGDLYAVKSIMGHADEASDMSPIYREIMTDSRLRAVVDFVHAWLEKAVSSIQ